MGKEQRAVAEEGGGGAGGRAGGGTSVFLWQTRVEGSELEVEVLAEEDDELVVGRLVQDLF